MKWLTSKRERKWLRLNGSGPKGSTVPLKESLTLMNPPSGLALRSTGCLLSTGRKSIDLLATFLNPAVGSSVGNDLCFAAFLMSVVCFERTSGYLTPGSIVCA
jgi:hypothetical protein